MNQNPEQLKIDLTELIENCLQLRKCQKIYFQTRNSISLNDAKKQEKKIDALIKSLSLKYLNNNGLYQSSSGSSTGLLPL